MRPIIRRLIRTLAPVAALAVFFFPDAAPSAGEQRPPNIVLIISDDHAWTDYSFMGHEAVRTPRLDELASQSLVYTRGYVPASLCRPSLATMMTGLYPHQHRITGNDPDGEVRDAANRNRMVQVFQESMTVAGILYAKKGYVSHQSGKWWEGQCQCGGFTECMTHGDVARGGRHGDEGLKIGRESMKPVFDFIDRSAERPFFLWYAPFLPHTPHNPPERLLAQYQAPGRPEAVAKYYAMVEWLDETVGQLLGYLDDKGLTENTVVLYVADNGWIQTADPRQWFESRSKVSPYDAGLRTPIMVKWPGHVEPARNDSSLASSIDLAPTILRAAGIEPPGHMPGLDLTDRAEMAARDKIYGALFAHTAVDVESPVRNLKYRWTLRKDGWKLIEPYTPNAAVELMIRPWAVSWMSQEVELYNVLEDAFEKTDRAAVRPELVRDLQRDLDAWWSVPR
jgi:arylsulfatase A-like enzyme